MTWVGRILRWSECHRYSVDFITMCAWLLLGAPLTSYIVGLEEDFLLTGGLILSFGPMFWRRRYPNLSAGIMYLNGYTLLVATPWNALISIESTALALYAIAAYGKPWAHQIAISFSAMASFFIAAHHATTTSTSGQEFIVSVTVYTIALTAFHLTVWALGLSRRTHLVTVHALRTRANQLEVDRDHQTQLAAAHERARIAREMHDIVAHSLSVIIAQADGGRYVAASDPAAAQTALTTIADTGRNALADMRQLLGVLRADAPHADLWLLAPQPGNHDLDALIADAQANGLRVSLVHTGAPRQLPPGAGLTIYRICQEALSNIRQHAGSDPVVTVAVHWLYDVLVLDIVDDGCPITPVQEPSGFGILGMRERAAVFGGTLSAGPRPGGGFQVQFRMPIPRR